MKGKPFSWTKYLEETGCESVPDFVFRDRSQKAHGFTTEMKLEAVDRKNPDLICVASVNNTVGDHFLIHFDEWDDSYDYWCKDDSPFIHPVGWCTKNNVPLIPPTGNFQIFVFNSTKTRVFWPLTYFSPMFHFYIPWKPQKTMFRFNKENPITTSSGVFINFEHGFLIFG